MASDKDMIRDRVMQHFSTELQKALTTKGWTKKRLKDECGVSIERYRSDDNGREPTLSSAVRIADALEISLDQLCGRSQYVQNMDKLTSGECIRLILILLDQLGGNISINGDYASLTFPPSNVTSLLCDTMSYKSEYERYYEGALRFAPDSHPKSVCEETRDYLKKQMERSIDPVDIELSGSDYFESFNGIVFLGPGCTEEVVDVFE